MLLNTEIITITTDELFMQEEFIGLSYADAWEKAIDLGWRWDIQQGHWYRIKGY
ncbi:hypothetical protein [Brevibacillus marinus]|uniref:hypothetical protein n=1 Tax=Brevibacillus marinus TaxID=2496837 RepID=UPI0013E09865|nr:hypothetical protein [Brevibacillus marinus]